MWCGVKEGAGIQIRVELGISIWTVVGDGALGEISLAGSLRNKRMADGVSELTLR